MSISDVPAAGQVLPALPYAYAALEPHIDARTMHVHHDQHHAAYVKNLNAALADLPELQGRSAEWLLLNPGAVPERLRATVHDNAGGHLNHSLLWKTMRPASDHQPSGELADAIRRDFGSVEEFRSRFEAAGAAVFGSGWAWLTRADGGGLQILTTGGHDNPITQGQYPILLNDVWEHAYYLKHEHRRPAYLAGWWPLVNWTEASRRFGQADQSAERDWEAEGGLVPSAAA